MPFANTRWQKIRNFGYVKREMGKYTIFISLIILFLKSAPSPDVGTFWSIAEHIENYDRIL
jgi:hypothetical protein